MRVNAGGEGSAITGRSGNGWSCTVQMFGLSTDGAVNGADTLYVGLRCDP